MRNPEKHTAHTPNPNEGFIMPNYDKDKQSPLVDILHKNEANASRDHWDEDPDVARYENRNEKAESLRTDPPSGKIGGQVLESLGVHFNPTKSPDKAEEIINGVSGEIDPDTAARYRDSMDK